jgi:hypothetical protein
VYVAGAVVFAVGQNSEWSWGPGNPDATTVVAVAPGSANDFAALLGHVYVCTGLRIAWPQLWPRLRHYD